MGISSAPFVADEATEQQIADNLNLSAHPDESGRAWTRGAVHQILINEKYIGTNSSELRFLPNSRKSGCATDPIGGSGRRCLSRDLIERTTVRS